MDILTEFHKKCGLVIRQTGSFLALRQEPFAISEYPLEGAMSAHKIRQDADEYLIGVVNRGQRG